MLVHFLPMEGFFCEKLLGILVVLELVEELFWDKLLIKRGEFEEELEEEPLVEQLLENNDDLLEPASFFHTFPFSSMKNKGTVISRISYGTVCVCV